MAEKNKSRDKAQLIFTRLQTNFQVKIIPSQIGAHCLVL